MPARSGSRGGARSTRGRGSSRTAAKPRTAAGRQRAAKSVYFFGNGRAEGRGSMRDLLGGKGANLAEMTRLGIPVPPGFTISTEMCREFYRRKRRLGPRLAADVQRALRRVERAMGSAFGDPANPLLVSVRSGARASMPGMMDTVLNLGLNDRTVEGLTRQSGDRRFALDSYRRFIQMYSNVVLGVPLDAFEERLSAIKRARDHDEDDRLEPDDLERLIAEYKQVVRDGAGRSFPQGVNDQLLGAIAAVFDSWHTPRAVTYRALHGIPDAWGTAVNVQAMVFGNLGEDSATGVAFTRDPATGERRFFGEYLPNAQGEDVVAGIRTPRSLNRASRRVDDPPSLEEIQPRCYRALERIARRLERHYRDMQDLEFTIQRGTLWMLQTRTGKRTAQAAVRIAVDMARERLIDRATALKRIAPQEIDRLLHPALDTAAAPPPLGRGLPASPGAASGAAVFTPEEAEARFKEGEDVILVRRETSAEDIHGMHAARGILTALGGMTSHAAVVARGMGKCCVTGCVGLEIDMDRRVARLDGVEVAHGEVITLDGSTGHVFKGRVPTVVPRLGADFRTLMRWADDARRLGLRTNADTPGDAAVARDFGAEGIGLCRTEHMFFQEERILAVRRMILAATAEERAVALRQILPMQREDFVGIFREMPGLPVTIRLLDPPLHEFLPQHDDEIVSLAEDLQLPVAEVRRKVEALREFNPMLGHRGCRLGITYPEIYEMQARAIFEAACQAAKAGSRPRPEIMIPLVGDPRELEILRDLVERTADKVFKAERRRVRYSVGTMIEVPRAALLAGRIAEVAEFFSFGTNDLTQMALGLSRDDAGRFLQAYAEQGIYSRDPFVSLDTDGVGQLISEAIAKGRAARRELKVGICGEHGGDPESIRFCDRAGFDYVSCSPYRVPVARLAAAQAALQATSSG